MRPEVAIRATAAALALVAAAGCRHPETAAPPDRRRVRCAAAVTATITDAIELRGTVSPLPERDAQVAPQVAGRLLRVPVREGDAVVVGQPIAFVDDAPLVDEARAAQAAVTRFRAEHENARATSTRVQRVYEHGIAARQELDDARARADTTAAALSEAEAAAHRARRQVERATVGSPLKGVVIRIFRRPGELVDGTPATPVVEVADPSQLELTTNATASDLVRIQKGQAAEVAVAALPGATWTGRVAAVSPAIDRATGLGVVRVALDLTTNLAASPTTSPTTKPRPPIGVLGTARIHIGAARPVVVVPPAAVRTGAGTEAEVVLCGADGIAHVRSFGWSAMGRGAPGRGAGGAADVEVPGLAAGQSVVVEPVLGIADGEPIEVAP